VALVALGLTGPAVGQTVETEAPDHPPIDTAPPAVREVPVATPPAPAAAAAFGEAWHLALSIERAFGLDYISATESSSGLDLQKTSATNVSLFGAPATGAPSAFSFPRVAFDLFVVRDFSFGLGVGVVHGSSTVTPTGSIPSDRSFTGLVAVPRVGYARQLTPYITLWPRAGISVIYVKSDVNNGFGYGTAQMPTHFVAATIEVPVLFTLIPHVAVTLGPTLDITFNGSTTVPPLTGGVQTYAERVTELGIQAGLLVYL
jgi:hypothetical protein